MASGKERRQEVRHRIQRDVVPDLVTVGLSEDISNHGLRMIGLADNSVGQPVRLHLEVEAGRLIPVQGTVAWKESGEDGVRLGVRIATPAQAWRAFVEEVRGRGERQGAESQLPPRSAPRFAAIIPARYGMKSNEEEDCVLLDVSPGGVQLQGPVAPPAGTSIFVRLQHPEVGSAQLIGRVVWRAAEGEYPRVGIRLESADESYYRLLTKLARPRKQPQPPKDDLLDGVDVTVGERLLDDNE